MGPAGSNSPSSWRGTIFDIKLRSGYDLTVITDSTDFGTYPSKVGAVFNPIDAVGGCSHPIRFIPGTTACDSPNRYRDLRVTFDNLVLSSDCGRSLSTVYYSWQRSNQSPCRLFSLYDVNIAKQQAHVGGFRNAFRSLGRDSIVAPHSFLIGFISTVTDCKPLSFDNGTAVCFRGMGRDLFDRPVQGHHTTYSVTHSIGITVGCWPGERHSISTRSSFACS